MASSIKMDLTYEHGKLFFYGLLTLIRYPVYSAQRGQCRQEWFNICSYVSFDDCGTVPILLIGMFGFLSKCAWKFASFVAFCLHIRN